MKKLIITCLLLSSASVVSFAQSNAAPQPNRNAPGGPNKPVMNSQQMAERRTKADVQQFGLNPEQAKKVQAVELDFFSAMEKYRAAGQQPNIGQMGNLNARRDAKMKEILTPEQYAKFEAGRNKERVAPAPANANQPTAAPTN